MATLENKVALVTGATSGIGKAAALALGTAGAKVVFSGRRDQEGEATAALIRGAGADCLFVRSDVSSEEDIKALVQKTVETYGRLDCAFNNAGIEPPSKPLHEQSMEDFDKLMAINVRGLFLCMKYEIQQMLSQGSGAIVNNSSIGGLIGFPGVSPYIASKHAVMGLTRSAALDYAINSQRTRVATVPLHNISGFSHKGLESGRAVAFRRKATRQFPYVGEPANGTGLGTHCPHELPSGFSQHTN